MKNTDIKLQTLQDKDLILLLENKIGAGFSSVMGDRYGISSDNKKLIYMDDSSLYGHSMPQSLPSDGIEMWHHHPDLYMIKLEEISNTPDDNDIRYSIEVDLKYPDDIKGITKIFPFVPENKIIDKNEYNDYMKKPNLEKLQKVKNYYVIGLMIRSIRFNIDC